MDTSFCWASSSLELSLLYIFAMIGTDDIMVR